jgi:hypothetical protein
VDCGGLEREVIIMCGGVIEVNSATGFLFVESELIEGIVI